jgi:cyclase
MRILPRIIPALLIHKEGFIKSHKFKDYKYLGDPLNIVKIFNEKEVDELVILDIDATKNSKINYKLLEEIASEAFMPIAYGGGINTLEDAKNILSLGFEKIVLNNAAVKNPTLIKKISDYYGSQSVVVSIDVKKNILGKYSVRINNGIEKVNIEPLVHAINSVSLGAGEIIINSIDLDGTMKNYDYDLISLFTNKINVPIIALGGASCWKDLAEVINITNASAASASSIFVFQGPHKAVLISYPKYNEIESFFK